MRLCCLLFWYSLLYSKMLDESFRVFHNPVIVNSADYFVIAYSSVIASSAVLYRYGREME